MPLEYALYDNPLTPDPNDFAAKVQNPQNYLSTSYFSNDSGRALYLRSPSVMWY